MALPILTSNSPVSITNPLANVQVPKSNTVNISNPLAIDNRYAGGNQPGSTNNATASGGGGNVLGTTSNAPPTATPLPIATGPTAAQTQASSDFNTGLSTANSSIANATGQAAGDYNTSILDYLAGIKSSQNTINSNSVQNELARQQGLQGVRDMVGNGIQSGGVIIANDNAGTSSAGEALARAYGILGRQQASSVGNQAAQGQNKINTDEANLVAAEQQFQNVDNPQKKADTINGIVTNAQSALSYLNQQAAYASIPDRVNIDQQIATIKANAIAALSAYDAELSQGIAATGPEAQPQVQADASKLLNAGTAPASQFNYTTAIPASLQGTGQFSSDLPIFTSTQGNKNNQQSSLPLVTS